jgi:hypothetical protein
MVSLAMTWLFSTYLMSISHLYLNEAVELRGELYFVCQ